MTKQFQNCTLFLIIIFITLNNSCKKDIQGKLEKALQMAGSNRVQLEHVIDHYRNFPEKQKAACFLIENMPQFYTYSDKKLKFYESFFYQMDSIQKVNGSITKDQIKKLVNGYADLYGSIITSQLKKVPDIKNVNSNYLIENIDMAFFVWKNKVWAKNLSFSEFCEYILPYRYNNENITPWRFYLYKKNSSIIEYLNNPSDIYEVTTKLNENAGKLLTLDTDFKIYPFDLGLNELMKSHRGTCNDLVDYVLYSLRSIGIPVTSDYIVQWGNRSLGHSWNVILSPEKKMKPFTAGFGGFGDNVLAYKAPKIFRNTFSMQEDLPSSIEKDHENIPEQFRKLNFKDVTKDYLPVYNVKIKLQTTQHVNLAYLCVFNNSQWIPVFWGKVSSGEAVFNDMAGDIVYLPALFINGELIPFSSPFILDKQGKITQLEPKASKNCLKINRKYPIFWGIQAYAERMMGGWFEGSDNKDYSQAEIIYKIDKAPELSFNEVNIKNSNEYKYIRYVSPDNSWGNVAEIEFYSGGKKLNGKVMGTPGQEENPLANVFDNDKLSYYETYKQNGSWAGIELPMKQQITKIRFLPRNDQNNVIPKLDYELFYWQDGWRSMGRKISTSNELSYNNAPENSLFWLHCYSEGKEERIFTYEKGHQIWW